MLGRRHLLVVLSAIAMAIAVLVPAGTSMASDCPNADLVPSAENLAAVGQATLCLLNAERAAAQLAPLRSNAELAAASQAYSVRMVAESFFAHESPGGGTLVERLRASRYLIREDGWVVGENLAWGQGPLSTPRSIVSAWMGSSGHRANILSGEYVEIGLGIALGTPPDRAWGATYTTDFGDRDTADVGADAEADDGSPSASRAAAVVAARQHRAMVARVKAKARARARAEARERAAMVRAAKAKARTARVKARIAARDARRRARAAELARSAHR